MTCAYSPSGNFVACGMKNLSRVSLCDPVFLVKVAWTMCAPSIVLKLVKEMSG